MDFFKKIREKKEEAKSQAEQKKLAAAVEKRLKSKTVPATEEPKASGPGASAREYYEYALAVKDKGEMFFAAFWLIAEFYFHNKGMGEEYVNKALTVYQQLIRAFFTSDYVRKHKAELLSEYFNADEAQLRICSLYCLDLKQPEKALPYYGNFGESFPNSKYVQYCADQNKIIKENRGDKEALGLFLQADYEHGHQRYTQARHGFDEVVEKFPDSKLALHGKMRLGDILFFQEKDIKAAGKAYDDAVAKWGIGEHTSRALYQLGECCREGKEWEKAIEYYGQYVMDAETKFRVDFAKYYMGVCHEQLSHWDEAEAAYEGVLAMEKGYWRDKAAKRVEEIKKARQRGTLELLSETLRVRKK